MSELKDLSEILIVKDELPADFFTNDLYDQQLDLAIEATNSLVYTLDDVGEKQANSDATSINKFVRMFDGFIAKTFKQQTSSISLWRDDKKAKTKILLKNRQKLIDQFIERRQEILDKISADLHVAIQKERESAEIEHGFYSDVDFSSLIKLTGTLTPKGSLTKKANDFIQVIVTNEKANQNKIKARHLYLENRCLRAEINPPLTHIHLGTDFYADDDVFDAKVEALVEAEVDRKAEMEARIIKQQEAKKQEEINAALKAQQAESDAIARARVEGQQKTEPVKQDNNVQVAAEEQVQAESDPEPVKKPINGKHEVIITAKFRMQVSDRVSNQSVADYFIKQLPEKLDSARFSVIAES